MPAGKLAAQTSPKSRKNTPSPLVEMDSPLPMPLSSDLSDESLLVQYHQTGDRAIFQTLIARYEREIYSYLCRYMGEPELARDAFQGTFLQVHLKCGQFDQSRRFKPWLYAIATNQAIDLQRRNKRHRYVSLDRTSPSNDGEQDGQWAEKLVGSSIDPLDAASDGENREWVVDYVGQLNESMQQVIHLVYYKGMKYREAAEVLGIPVGTVKSRLHAAINRMTVMWEESHHPVEED